MKMVRLIGVLVIAAAAAAAAIWYGMRRETQQYEVRTVGGGKTPLIPLAIIGSGPAGLSAALYAGRMNVTAVVFAGPQRGGQLMGTSLVENWPGAGIKLGPTIMAYVQKQAEQFGAQCLPLTVEKVDLSHWPFRIHTDTGLSIEALAIIIATGSTPKRLSVPGESEYWGRGVGTCAVCDAPFYKNKRVVVVGGGDSAMEMALELAHFASEVILLVRGDSLRASSVMQERVRATKQITLRFNTQVAEIRGTTDQVTELLLHDGTILPTSALFLAIGHTPNTALFGKPLLRDEAGYILLPDRSQKTTVAGVFAAGDAADRSYKQAAVASGDGVKAALDAIAFLRDVGFTQEEDERLRPLYLNPKEALSRVRIPEVHSLKELEDLLQKEKRPIVLDFYTPYCPSCMQMLPSLEMTAADYREKLVFRKIDASKLPEAARRFSVPMVPTLLVFEQGVMRARSTESLNYKQLVAFCKVFVTSHEDR